MTPKECYYEITRESKQNIPFDYLKLVPKLDDKAITKIKRMHFFKWEERKTKSMEYARKRREKIK